MVTGGVTTSFTYDALGRRATKTVNGTATKFLYDGAQLIAETDGAGTLTARYLFGPRLDEPLERKSGSTTSYYAADGLGSVAHLTTSAGAIAETYTYETFGKLTIKNAGGTTLSTSALGNRFTFTGREYDSETGLYYYRARYYSPVSGRFLSRDPLGYLPDANLYRYVGNNPSSFMDPLGLEAKQSSSPPAENQTGQTPPSQSPAAKPPFWELGVGSCCGASRDCSRGAPAGADAQQQACAAHDSALNRLNQPPRRLRWTDHNQIVFDNTGRPYRPIAALHRKLLEASTNPFVQLAFGTTWPFLGLLSDTTIRTPYPRAIPDPRPLWDRGFRGPILLPFR